MTQEQRRYYRVRIGETEPVGIVVATHTGECAEGTVADISAGGAGAQFPVERAPRLVIGQHVLLTLSSRRLGRPITVAGKIRSRVELGAFRRYGFEFDIDEADRELSRSLRRLFNRRRAYRVRPATREPIFARIVIRDIKIAPPPRTARVRADPADLDASDTAPDKLATLPEGGQGAKVPSSPPDPPPGPPQGSLDPQSLARIKDISVRGASLLVEPEIDELLASVDVVEIRFFLPGVGTMQQFHCNIRRREWESYRVLYGVEFDAERSPEFGHQQDVIGEYVMRRQREEWPLDHSFAR